MKYFPNTHQIFNSKIDAQNKVACNLHEISIFQQIQLSKILLFENRKS